MVRSIRTLQEEPISEYASSPVDGVPPRIAELKTWEP